MATAKRDEELAQLRDQHLEEMRKTCRHFNGLGNPIDIDRDAKECKAGINYRALVGGEDKSWALHIPCHGPEPRSERNMPIAHCPFYEKKTREEVEWREREQQAHVAKMLLAVTAIVEHASGRRPHEDWVDCPNCHGRLHYRLSGKRGIWAACATSDCVRFMQ